MLSFASEKDHGAAVWKIKRRKQRTSLGGARTVEAEGGPQWFEPGERPREGWGRLAVFLSYLPDHPLNTSFAHCLLHACLLTSPTRPLDCSAESLSALPTVLISVVRAQLSLRFAWVPADSWPGSTQLFCRNVLNTNDVG